MTVKLSGTWNGNGGSQTEAEQAGRQAGVWAAGSSQAWQAQAHRVKAGKCNYHGTKAS